MSAEQKNQNTVTPDSLLASTKEAQQYVEQSIQQSAVNEVNVKVLANAILNLAGDAGSLPSITSQTNYGPDITTQAQNTYELNDKVAYSAELAAQQAMECAMLASELSFTNILQKLQASPGKEIVADLKNDYAAALVLAQKIADKTNELTQHIKTMAYQLIDAVEAAESLEALFIKTQILNPLVSSDLTDLAKKLSTDAEDMFSLLPVTLRSAYAASSLAIQCATITSAVNDQVNHLN